MFGLSDTATRIVEAIVVVVAIFGFGYMKGHRAVQVKFDAYKAEVQAAADQQTKESAKVDARNAKLFKDTQDAYNTQLANLRAYYLMRNNGKGLGTVPQVPNAPAGADGYSPDNLPPTPILAGQCAETTLKYVMLQSFILKAQNNAE